MKITKILSLLAFLFYISISVYATKYTITASGTSFSPSSLNGVHVGDTIKWQWVSGSHTTTSKNIPAGAGSWDSSLSSGNPTFEYKVTTAGTYHYVCTPHESMGMIGTFTVVGTTAIHQDPINKTGDFSVYPNPFKDDLYVSMQTEFPLNGVLEINSLSGGVISRIPFNAAKGISYQLVPTENIENGTYFLNVYTNKKLIATKKIIKN